MALLQDITYGGDNKTFVWKSPIEDFSYGSSLTVGESQKAIFFMNGEALDIFDPGRHVLETSNIPLLGKAVNALYGGDTPFHSSIYFVNMVDQLAIKWGTESKVEYTDPVYRFPLKIGMSGEMILAVENPRKLIIKLVGSEPSYTQDKAVDNFKGILLTKLKPFIAKYMIDNKVNIFDVDACLEDFNNELFNQMIPEYDEYGMALRKLYVTNVVKPEGDRNYEHFKNLHYQSQTSVMEGNIAIQRAALDAQARAVAMDIESKALAEKRAREGYTYQQERGFDVAHDVARNEAIGQFTNMGIGLGTMSSVGSVVGGVMSDSLNNTVGVAAVNQAQHVNTPATEDSDNDPVKVLSKLKELLDNGLISQEEFDEKKKEILGRM